jgi:hypothetical protein
MFTRKLCITFLSSLAFAAWQPPAHARAANRLANKLRGLRLVAAAAGTPPTSGGGVRLTIEIVNKSKLPVCLTQPQYHPDQTLVFLARYGRTSRRAPATAYLRWSDMAGMFRSVNNVSLGLTMIRPGATRLYNRVVSGGLVDVSRYVDLTLPGKYRLRVGTKYTPRLVAHPTVQIPAGPNSVELKRISRAIEISQGLAGQQAGTKSRLWSNWLTVKILPPYSGPFPAALAPAGAGARKIGAPAKPGVAFVLAAPDVKGPGPIVASAFLECTGHGAVALRLTGDPQLDISAVEMQRPYGFDHQKHVMIPAPHWEYLKKPPGLTAYGKWLLKHPPKKLPEKTYDLKPGVVYKYAVPINLSCQYDMSLAGVYHVRVELAHPKIWSNWVTVKVPS